MDQGNLMRYICGMATSHSKIIQQVLPRELGDHQGLHKLQAARSTINENTQERNERGRHHNHQKQEETRRLHKNS